MGQNLIKKDVQSVFKQNDNIKISLDVGLITYISPQNLPSYWSPYPQWFDACSLHAALWFWCVLLCVFACACTLGFRCSIVGRCHRPKWSESSSILHSALCSVFAHCWLLSSALWCVRAAAPTQPPGIWEEQSRIYTDKFYRYMECHYFPLFIILPLLFILWATLAVFLARPSSICTVYPPFNKLRVM